MQSFLNPLGMDIASSASAIDELFDEVLPVGGEPQQAAAPAAPPAAAQGSLVHKDMWDNFLTDDLVAPGGAERGKRNRAAASISSQFSDDGLPLRASFCGIMRPEDSPSLNPRPNSNLNPTRTPSRRASRG